MAKTVLKRPGDMSLRKFFFNFYGVIAILVLFEKLLRLILFIVHLKFDFFTITEYEAFSLAHNKHKFMPICKSSII